MPDAASVTAAGAGIIVDEQLLFSALDAAGDNAYPVTAQSWCVVYAKQSDRARGEAVKAYLQFLITDAQTLLSEIDFAPIPKELQDKALAQLAKLQIPST
jgi:phosphate transport system substrate-binding protein